MVSLQRVQRGPLSVLLGGKALHRGRLVLRVLVVDSLLLGVLLLLRRRELEQIGVLARHDVQIVRRQFRGGLGRRRQRHLRLQILPALRKIIRVLHDVVAHLEERFDSLVILFVERHHVGEPLDVRLA